MTLRQVQPGFTRNPTPGCGVVRLSENRMPGSRSQSKKLCPVR